MWLWFGFEQKFWQIDGFGENRHWSADLHTPIHPLMSRFLLVGLFVGTLWKTIPTSQVLMDLIHRGSSDYTGKECPN